MGCNLPVSDAGDTCGTSDGREGLCLPTGSRVMVDDRTGLLVPDADYIKAENTTRQDLEGVCSTWVGSLDAWSS